MGRGEINGFRRGDAGGAGLKVFLETDIESITHVDNTAVASDIDVDNRVDDGNALVSLIEIEMSDPALGAGVLVGDHVAGQIRRGKAEFGTVLTEIVGGDLFRGPVVGPREEARGGSGKGRRHRQNPNECQANGSSFQGAFS